MLVQKELFIIQYSLLKLILMSVIQDRYYKLCFYHPMATDFKELYFIGMSELGFKGTLAHKDNLVE